MQNTLHRKPSLRESISEFFYAQEVPYGMALVRILLCLVLLGVMLQRWPHVREIYSLDGATAQLTINYQHGKLMPEFSGEIAVALFAMMLFFFASSVVGWNTRLSLICSTGLYSYFCMLDCIGTMTKYSVIATHALFILSLSECGAIWSVDAWRKRSLKQGIFPGDPRKSWPTSSIWPRRLMQFMIAYVYLGAAMTKIHTPAYFSGDQLKYWILTQMNYSNPVGELMTLFPALLGAFSYVAIVWEVLFLFLAWRGWGRFVMLTMGVIFHIMTWQTLGLRVFPMICISIYFSFFNANDAVALAAYFRRVKRSAKRSALGRWAGKLSVPELKPSAKVPSSLVYGSFSAVVMLGGIGMEYLMDPYDLRRPEGPHALKPIETQVALSMIRNEQPLRPVDKLFSFEVGSHLFCDNLVGRRYTFKQGETAIAQCCLNPPHEDMYVECHLMDEQGRVIDRVGTVVAREDMRASFAYPLSCGLPPGNYQILLKSAGNELARRPLTVLPAENAVCEQDLSASAN